MRSSFSIIGPVMVGPSSSHTAGAAKIGRMVRNIMGEDLVKVNVFMHGSFAATGIGHGSDLAIIAGLLGFREDDERIRAAFSIAEEKGMEYKIYHKDLGNLVHPNTMLLEVTGISGNSIKVIGSSVGGGNIIITSIDDYPIEFTGDYDAMITIHRDAPGLVASISGLLATEGINIAFLRLSRKRKGAEALMIIETDNPISEKIVEKVREMETVQYVFAVRRLEE